MQKLKEFTAIYSTFQNFSVSGFFLTFKFQIQISRLLDVIWTSDLSGHLKLIQSFRLMGMSQGSKKCGSFPHFVWEKNHTRKVWFRGRNRLPQTSSILWEFSNLKFFFHFPSFCDFLWFFSQLEFFVICLPTRFFCFPTFLWFSSKRGSRVICLPTRFFRFPTFSWFASKRGSHSPNQIFSFPQVFVISLKRRESLSQSDFFAFPGFCVSTEQCFCVFLVIAWCFLL